MSGEKTRRKTFAQWAALALWKLVRGKVREFIKTMTIWFQLVEHTFVCGNWKATTTDRPLDNGFELENSPFHCRKVILWNHCFQLKFSCSILLCKL